MDTFQDIISRFRERAPHTQAHVAEEKQAAGSSFVLPWLKQAKKKKREQPAGYIKETAEIKARCEAAGAKAHKFQAAKWTHPNGHPRCKICGDEERIDGQCDGYKAAASEPFWQRAGMAQLANPMWRSETGVFGNLANNLQQTHQRGQQMVSAQDAANDMASSQSSQASMSRLRRFLSDGDFVKDPVDQALFRPLA